MGISTDDTPRPMKIFLAALFLIPFAFGVRHGIRANRSPNRAFLERWDDARRAYEKHESVIRRYLP